MYIHNTDFIADIKQKSAMSGDAVAKHIGYPKGIERMISYLRQVRPNKVELVVDEMISIRSEIDAWQEKKASQRANAAYNEILNSDFGDQNNKTYK